ncbi:MAG: methyl-accepting chemotaxis protein [Notoacmeibacter sp.]|nr:methyl-accepting chemotaxis protein [Notoacmeibacter sp.]
MLFRIRIAHRIAIAAAVPLLALVADMSVRVVSNYSHYQQMEKIGGLAAAITRSSELINALQVERGLTAGFIGAGAGPVPANLAGARKTTDLEIANFVEIAGVVEAANQVLAGKSAQLKRNLDTLADFRAGIDNRRVSGPESLKQYSAMIAELLSINISAAELSPDAPIAEQIVALSSLSNAKERAGQERALVNGILNSGEMNEGQYLSLSNQIAAQDLLLGQFLETLGADSRPKYQALLKQQDSGAVEGYRQKLLEKRDAIDEVGIAPADWFEATTKRIEKLHDVEVAVASDISGRAGAIATESRSAVFMMLLAAVLAVLGSLASVLIVGRTISKPLGRLRAAMIAISGGELDTEIPGRERSDELGEMAGTVEVFRENALERVRLEAEADANRSLSEKERIERERRQAKEAAEVKFAVDNLATGLGALADGKLSYRIDTAFSEQLDKTRCDFNAAVERLEDTMRQVGRNTQAILSGSNEIQSAADDLSKRTEQQAASVEETAAAVVQVTSSMKESAARAEEAGHLVSRTKATAEQSGQVMRQAIAAMGEIETSSQEIGNIVGVIDDIAFQTNLLALNAGVEAARAGDAGKGFAVVAQEVRELAQRSAEAAKEIKTLITSSNQQVHSGVSLVGETSKVLEGMVAEVQDINDHVRSIVEAVSEQSRSLQEINTAVTTIDQSTQQNAAMVEQSTAATIGLTNEISSLNDLLAQFDVSGSDRAPEAVEPTAKSVDSPARAIIKKLASVYPGSGNAAVKQDEWEEF